MAVTKIKSIKSTLNKALDYIQNPDKTDGKMLVSSFGCSYETADIEFEYTLSQALQKGNNLAFHLIQSFEPGEVDYETAHKIGKQLADAVTKGQHEYVLTTHKIRATAKQMICRFVRLKATFVLTLDKSFGTGTYAKRKPPFCGEKPRVSFNVR